MKFWGVQVAHKTGIVYINNNLHFRAEAYLFAPANRIEKNELLQVRTSKNTFDKTYFQALAALVYHTGVGPISLSANYYEKTDTNLYLTLSFGYILFNKRGF